MNGSYAGWRQRRREEERSVTHAHRPVIEKERGRENRPEYVVFRPDLSLYPARERCRVWVSAGSGWKPRRPCQIRLELRGFHISGTLFGRLDPAVPSRSRHPCESTNPKRKNPFDPKQIQNSVINSILLH